jgi:O-antigen/teichoic acid export membrane protein
LGNQRIYIYLLESLLHQGYLFSGIFAIFLYVAEAIWTVGKSLSSILTSLVAQSNDKLIQLNYFKKYLRLSTLGTLILIIAAFIFPKQFLEPFFKQSTSEIQLNLLLMSPAILVHSITTPISHFFSGIGLLKYNFHCALAGLISGLLSALYLIPYHELNGAFIAISIGFTTQCSLHVYYFMKWKSNLNRKDSEPLLAERE